MDLDPHLLSLSQSWEISPAAILKVKNAWTHVFDI